MSPELQTAIILITGALFGGALIVIWAAFEALSGHTRYKSKKRQK